MQLRELGRSGIKIAPLMLGTNVFGWNVDEKTSFAILDAFVDAGFNGLDTADSYSRWVPGHTGGESETIIGNWVKSSGKRDKIVIATKVGSDMGEGISVRKDYILRSAEASLKRLQTDCIDLYQTHFDDENTPVEETMAAYAQLVKDGKVRAIGASNITPRPAQGIAWRRARRMAPRATKACSRSITCRTAMNSRHEYGPICRAEKYRRHQLLRPGGGLPLGQVRHRRGSRQAPRPRRPAQALFRCARHAHPQGAARDRAAPQCDAGADRARLADRAALDHRADRERDRRRAASRTDEGARHQAVARGPCRARRSGLITSAERTHCTVASQTELCSR